MRPLTCPGSFHILSVCYRAFRTSRQSRTDIAGHLQWIELQCLTLMSLPLIPVVTMSISTEIKSKVHTKTTTYQVFPQLVFWPGRKTKPLAKGTLTVAKVIHLSVTSYTDANIYMCKILRTRIKQTTFITVLCRLTYFIICVTECKFHCSKSSQKSYLAQSALLSFKTRPYGAAAFCMHFAPVFCAF